MEGSQWNCEYTNSQDYRFIVTKYNINRRHIPIGNQMKKINYNQLSAFLNINREFYYKLAYGYVHNNNEALLMLQVSICNAFETVKKLYNPLALKSWFYQIVVDTSIKYLNDKQRFIIVKTEDDITIPEELEKMVKQTTEEVEKKIEFKKLLLICLLSIVTGITIIAYLYIYIRFGLKL